MFSKILSKFKRQMYLSGYITSCRMFLELIIAIALAAIAILLFLIYANMKSDKEDSISWEDAIASGHAVAIHGENGFIENKWLPDPYEKEQSLREQLHLKDSLLEKKNDDLISAEAQLKVFSNSIYQYEEIIREKNEQIISLTEASKGSQIKPAASDKDDSVEDVIEEFSEEETTKRSDKTRWSWFK